MGYNNITITSDFSMKTFSAARHKHTKYVIINTHAKTIIIIIREIILVKVFDIHIYKK